MQAKGNAENPGFGGYGHSTPILPPNRKISRESPPSLSGTGLIRHRGSRARRAKSINTTRRLAASVILSSKSRRA